MNALLALFQGPVGAWSFGEILIALIMIGAAIGIAYVFFQYIGWQPPPWLIKIIMIVVVACVAIIAIRMVLGM